MAELFDKGRSTITEHIRNIFAEGELEENVVCCNFRHTTQRLKEYIVKGFSLNDERFKTGQSMNYFSELQERIREIRLSERFVYRKIKDIYATSTTQRALTIIRRMSRRFCFSRRCRTSCCERSASRQRRSWCIVVRMRHCR